MMTVRDASFQFVCGQSRKSVAEVSEAGAVLVQSFGELFNQAKRDVQRREEYPVSAHQRLFMTFLALRGTNPFRTSQSFFVNAEFCPCYPRWAESTCVW